MRITVTNASPLPIYEQITQQVKQAILTGEVAAGTALPSIRQLARDLRVSVITTTRAYNDLARDGFIVSVPGKGAFVQPVNSDLIREPLAGRAYTCPVSREATIWIVSLSNAVANLLHLAQVDPAALGPRRALNTPALAVSIAHIIEAIARFDPTAAAQLTTASSTAAAMASGSALHQ